MPGRTAVDALSLSDDMGARLTEASITPDQRLLPLPQHRDLGTHGYVVAETLAVARRRFGVDGVITVLDDLLPIIDVLPVEPAVHASAQSRYRASLPSGTSFVDQVSFGVMAQASIETAFALDADFKAAGVSVVPAS